MNRPQDEHEQRRTGRSRVYQSSIIDEPSA